MSGFLMWLLSCDGEFYAGVNEKYPQFMVSAKNQTLSAFDCQNRTQKISGLPSIGSPEFL